MSQDTVAILDLPTISPPKENPRIRFNQNDLAELAESIAQHGILQPILVRPYPQNPPRFSDEPDYHYELVAGERRYRAAKMAGLTTIPAMIRDLDDRAVLEVQVIENLIREGLHPLEEAEGYRRLIDDHDYRVEDLVLKIGKSRSYVYARMKLADIPDIAREAMWAGTLSHSTALLIARIPDVELQQKATSRILEGDHWESPMSYRRSLELIQSDYMLRLAEASFPIKDKKLVPEAGSCVDCPKRTGNQRDLFPDIKSADVCTDPPCYKDKEGAHWDRVQAKAMTAGKKMLPKGDKDVIQWGYTAGDKYADLKARNYQAPNQETWGKLLGKDAPQVFLGRDHKQKVYELVLRKDAEKVIKKKYKWEDAPENTDRKERQFEAKVHKLAAKRAMAAIAEGAQGVGASREFWHVLALCGIERGYEAVESVGVRLGLEPKKKDGSYAGPSHDAPVIEAMETMTAAQLRTVVVEILTASIVMEWGDTDKLRTRVEKLFGVNHAAITRGAKKDLQPKPAKPSAGNQKKAKKAPTPAMASPEKTPSRGSEGTTKPRKSPEQGETPESEIS